jgi:hypothetical protein
MGSLLVTSGFLCNITGTPIYNISRSTISLHFLSFILCHHSWPEMMDMPPPSTPTSTPSTGCLQSFEVLPPLKWLNAFICSSFSILFQPSKLYPKTSAAPRWKHSISALVTFTVLFRVTFRSCHPMLNSNPCWTQTMQLIQSSGQCIRDLPSVAARWLKMAVVRWGEVRWGEVEPLTRLARCSPGLTVDYEWCDYYHRGLLRCGLVRWPWRWEIYVNQFPDVLTNPSRFARH